MRTLYIDVNTMTLCTYAEMRTLCHIWTQVFCALDMNLTDVYNKQYEEEYSVQKARLRATDLHNKCKFMLYKFVGYMRALKCYFEIYLLKQMS